MAFERIPEKLKRLYVSFNWFKTLKETPEGDKVERQVDDKFQELALAVRESIGGI
jgi:hypothetical protein